MDSFVTENPFGAPGGCASTPEPIDGDHDRFTLVWDPPKHDGGSKVTGYQVKDTEQHSSNPTLKWVRVLSHKVSF